MIAFFLIAALLVLLAIAAIAPSALRASKTQHADQLALNVRLAKEQRQALLTAFENGGIDQSTFDAEMAAIEASLANDIAKQSDPAQAGKQGWIISIAIALFLPLASGALYLRLGDPEGINTDAKHETALAARQAAQSQTPPALADLLPNLEKKLEENPDDIEGWKLLGRSYLTTGNFPSAKTALLRAYALDGQDTDVLSLLAEASAMSNGGDLSGEPSEYLAAALELDPEHRQSRWLTAVAHQQAGRHQEAITELISLRSTVLGNEDAMASIDDLIATSRASLEQSAAPAGQSQSAANQQSNVPANDQSKLAAEEQSNEPTTKEINGASLTLTVSLADDVTDKVNATDTVFVFARASSGPPMPLAVARLSVADLPATLQLDDSMAMMPAMTLSQFPEVVVGARVSKTGNAIAASGDWFTESGDITVADQSGTIALTIDTLKE